MPETTSDETTTDRFDRSSLVELQRLLLPPALPPIGCTEAAAHYRVHNDAFRLGGDWYDLIDRPDDQVVAIVGDVVGHGVHQISVMAQLRAAANALGRTLDDPAEIIEALDRFAADVPGAAYASVAVAMLDGTTTVRLAVAGHPPLVHVRRTGEIEIVEVGRGPLLGIPGERTTGIFHYEVDDVILMYTDGLTDRRGADADQVREDVAAFVRERLDAPCNEIAAAVIDRFAPDADDDVVVLALRPRNHRSPSYLLQPRLAPSIVFD